MAEILALMAAKSATPAPCTTHPKPEKASASNTAPSVRFVPELRKNPYIGSIPHAPSQGVARFQVQNFAEWRHLKALRFVDTSLHWGGAALLLLAVSCKEHHRQLTASTTSLPSLPPVIPAIPTTEIIHLLTMSALLNRHTHQTALQARIHRFDAL